MKIYRKPGSPTAHRPGWTGRGDRPWCGAKDTKATEDLAGVVSLCRSCWPIRSIAREAAVREFTEPAVPEGATRSASDPSFASTSAEASFHDGKPVWFATCYELVDGRWEGFVSMWQRRVAQ